MPVKDMHKIVPVGIQLAVGIEEIKLLTMTIRQR